MKETLERGIKVSVSGEEIAERLFAKVGR